jgi:AraC-like DNA-binding protein
MAPESWRLDTIPAADRDELWRQVVSTTHLPWSLDRPRDPAPATGNWVRRRPLGDLSLIDCRAAPCAGHRRRRDLLGTDGEYIGVLLVSEGAEVLDQTGHRVVIRPGEIVAWDSVRPARFAVLEPLRKQTLLVPRARFQQLLPRPELVIARTVPAGPTTAVLGAYLRALARSDLEPAAAFAAGNAALELLGAALGAVTTPSRTATRDAMRVRITQHIEARLGDREALRPQRIAADSAISVRTLHALFHDAGDTVGAYVRRRRLHRAHGDLTRPPWPAVTTVAHRWGFSDAANFSRSFRSQYGHAPSDAQRAARQAYGVDGG